MEGREFDSSWSSPSTRSGSSGAREIEEEAAEAPAVVEEKVYVAVREEFKAGRHNLVWILRNFRRDSKIVITHVHCPAQMINIMGAKFHASKLKPQQVNEHRQVERMKMHASLNKYLNLCLAMKAKVEKLVIEMDDVAQGLVELVAHHGITKLVMGAAADKQYSKKMKEPKSKKALSVKHKADLSCQIWFLCKGNLICTREASLNASVGAPSSMVSPSSIYGQAEELGSMSLRPRQREPSSWHSRLMQEANFGASGVAQSHMASPSSIYGQAEEFTLRSLPPRQRGSSSWDASPVQEARLHASAVSESPVASPISIYGQAEESRPWHASPVQDFYRRQSVNSHGDGTMTALPPLGPVKSVVPRNRLSSEGSPIDSWEGISMSSSPSSGPSFWSASDDLLSSISTLSLPKDEECEIGSVMLPSVHELEEDLLSSSNLELEDSGLDAEMYHKLKQALKEAENLKNEAYEESCRRRKAEMDSIQALRKAKASENLYTKELTRRKEIEETLAREKMEIAKLKDQRDEISEQLHKANEQKLALEQHIADSDQIAKDLEDKLSAARYLLHSLQAEYEVLQCERDSAIKESLCQMREQINRNYGELNSEFSYSELEKATDNFSDAMKIGEGGLGSVYKGILRNTTVAIKMLHPKRQGQSEFHQGAAVLGRLRHPNLVTLIGACSEAMGLVYEFLPNGSLEDRLVCVDNSPPLPWQVRTRIVAEICSALIFLHSNKPQPVVHGDLKLANILLDANLVSKLGDFGIYRLLIKSNTTARTRNCHMQPKGTFTYIDPEFLSTGELTPCSDVYSFGIIILQLLTGRPALGIAREVQGALDKEHLHALIDPAAGDWPFVQAKQLAHLGLRCCEMKPKSRPGLASEVWRVIDTLTKAASSSVSPSSFGSFSDDNSSIPSYFICPIFQDVMRDPHIAADGFTYEAEAIKGWFDGGHNTSPMTNLELPHCELTPNHALRSAIQEWLQQQKQPQQQS